MTHGKIARDGILAGIKKVTDAVKVTMGPKGRNVMLTRAGRTPIVTNDGVTVAKDIIFQDINEDTGASMMKDVAERTNKEAGDGTTSTIVLTEAIIKEGMKLMNEDINIFKLIAHMKNTTKTIVSRLIDAGTKIKTKDQIEQIATISSQNPEVGKVIADAFEEMGDNGTITVEEGSTIGLSRRVRKGLVVDRGFVTPLFKTNDTKQEAVIENPLIILTNATLTEISDMDTLIKNVVEGYGNKNVLLIANNIEGEALDSMILTKRHGMLNVCVVKAPGVGEKKLDELQDIAIATGATVIEEKDKLNGSEISIVGRASKAIINATETIILGGEGDQEKINKRIESLKTATLTTEGYEKENLEKRIARLGEGISTIYVLAQTEMETNNLKDKIEDALNATRASIQEGFTIGGGIALLNAGNIETGADTPEEAVAKEVLRYATVYPAKQIIENAGYNGDGAIKNILTEKAFSEGFSIDDGGPINLLKEGVIDPVKVIRVALENAVSTAIMLLTTEAVVSEEVLSDK